MSGNKSKLSFLCGFGLSLFLGALIVIPTTLQLQAANVNVNAVVPSTSATCGDGVLDSGETCDGSAASGNCYNGQCKGDCTCPVCGNGTIEVGETCEADSDCASGEGCSASCTCIIPSSFLAGTAITLPSGESKLIENLAVGETVLSYNTETKQTEPATIETISVRPADEYYRINDLLSVTAEHPLFVQGGWVAVKNLGLGDVLFGLHTDVAITNIQKIIAPVTVYNFHVDKNHNYFANEVLAHNKIGPCVPGPVTCGAWSSCVNNQQSRTCNNGCASFPQTRDCAVGCGDGVLDANGLDNISGNDDDEVCDDGNNTSGDCCSSSCRPEVLITNIAEVVTNTTATVSWSTLCGQTTDSLEWGITPSYELGSVTNLTGTNFSYQITGLTENTTYRYLITAVTGALQATHADTFLTAGGVEICTNGVDDDNDGLIDTADPNCPCQADWQCTPADWDDVVCINSQKTRSCVKVNTCWSDDPLPEEVIGCNLCEGVSCNPGYNINPESCECELIPEQCGNGICEPPSEDPYTCIQDCPASCLSDWDCSDYAPTQCPASGIQTRTCVDLNACPIPINPPDTQQSCSAQCPGLSCGAGETINIAQCICEAIVPYCGNGICEIGETHDSCATDCVPVCQPNWTCQAWGACEGGTQNRTCIDINNCGLDLSRPPEIRACTDTCNIACGTCQQLDSTVCACLPIALCCGDRVCESPEKSWSCAVDCGLSPDIVFTLSECLDGVDNDGDGAVDWPADEGCTGPNDNSELNALEELLRIDEFITQVIDNPQLEALANNSVPFVGLATATGILTSFSWLNLLAYLRYLFTQPVYLLFRRGRKKWGVVYHSLTKQPIDLAIVRLYRQDSGQLLRSRVTDRQGRFNFIAPPGTYYLTVTKPNFSFPSRYVRGAADGRYLDVYHGQVLEVTDKNAVLTPNVPIDSSDRVQKPRRIIIEYYLRKVQTAIAFSVVPITAVMALIQPSVKLFAFFVLHTAMYFLFRRLSYRRRPKSWGVVYDKDKKSPLGQAITRIYDVQYNKLLETRVTDLKGRYAFLVDNNKYYVTAERIGYKPTKTEHIDLVDKKREAIIDLNIGLEPGVGAAIQPTVAPAQVPPPGTPQRIVATQTAPVERKTITEELETVRAQEGVGRDSLEALMKAKAQASQLEARIEQEEEQLAELETRVAALEGSADQAAVKDAPKKAVEKKTTAPKTIKKSNSKRPPKPPTEKSIFG